jgi:hypothetical protein
VVTVGQRAALATWLLVAAACGKDAAPAPGDFGVNVTVDARGLPAATRERIARGILTAEGPGTTPVVRPLAIASGAIASGELRFRYIPASATGTLTLGFEALDGAGAVLASGRAAAFALTAGKAVAALIRLEAGGEGRDGGLDGPGVPDAPVDQASRKANGDPCAQGVECTSDFCVEGVCCNNACTGLCESCVAGQRGRCDPAPDGTDPKMQCGTPPLPDAGAPPDGGDAAGNDPPDGSIRAPDGGFMGSNDQCTGTCNGQRACRFPGGEKACGNRWCATATEVAAMTCDGEGSCSPALSSCVDYACAEGACNTRCAAHEECQAGKTYCNPNNQCAPKKADGLGCATGDECRSGHCAAGVCCNSACDTPFTCTETPGKCKCPGVTCAGGVACQVFYRDADGDGVGDKFGTLLNGGALAACADAAPPGYVASATDCDDGDANAKPGQTAFFDEPSNLKGTYDYNCDGTPEKGLPERLGSVCEFCQSGESVFKCGTSTSTCTTAGQRAGLSCSVQCTGSGRGPFLCFCQPSDGFVATVDCGVPGDYKVCGTCTKAGFGPAAPYSYSRKQTCR